MGTEAIYRLHDLVRLQALKWHPDHMEAMIEWAKPHVVPVKLWDMNFRHVILQERDGQCFILSESDWVVKLEPDSFKKFTQKELEIEFKREAKPQ